ncbi:hypothetical protein [Acidithiobacillus caldus]|jgi:hypothetical protein|uniref:HdeD family acid-resistance protein n=2 Tax=Acidithiobacillus caldus TaxID=33059 RepID=F9ZNI7_ACICS|nr:hypothetical protein [Acidithiobacillus caldus]AEK58250.1 conserved hypothetical protein [Acidithiobacillus caldus SM-1]AIA55226.1 hypothetical protein Acaty_c1359 [Acidithiobacillus caldus ATCC 51756]AUW32861.1 hypothetical protein A5904_07810 [Acidithiobacillus caldus]MBU2728731.1 hypothetical protein [Acidithiobacillus caldus]MBU2736947.1 hypothetical protein [Acidithiobacillus caldus ATCC 51756]
MTIDKTERPGRLTLFSWKLLFFRGLAALGFVLAALLDFPATMSLLVWFFVGYVFFDGVYSGLRLMQRGTGVCPRVLVGVKAILGIGAGCAVLVLALRGAQVPTLITIFSWIALVGAVEGLWVLRNVQNKELVLIIGSTAYLALAVALQMVFAVAQTAGVEIYSWIVIGFSAAFAAAMFGMSWAMHRNALHRSPLAGRGTRAPVA